MLLHPPLEYPTTSRHGGSEKRDIFDLLQDYKNEAKVSYVYDLNTVIYLPAGLIPFAANAATFPSGISSIGFLSTVSFGMESERNVNV